MDFLLTETKTGEWEWVDEMKLWRTKDSKIYTFNVNSSIVLKNENVGEYVDKSKVFLREIPAGIAKELIVKNHYSHTWSMCSVALGVFIKKEKSDDPFFDGINDELIGCIVYGSPVGRSAANSVSELVTVGQIYELTRLWIKDLPACKNIESYCISQSFDWLRKNRPQIKALLSYADNEAGHVGTIYQSTNWLYQGNSQIKIMPSYGLSLTGPNDGGYQWIHSRTVVEKFGSANVESLKKVIGKTFWMKKESSKHRYVYFLASGRERKKLIKSLKHPVYPYPKEDTYKEEIDEIYVKPEQKGADPFFDENA